MEVSSLTCKRYLSYKLSLFVLYVHFSIGEDDKVSKIYDFSNFLFFFTILIKKIKNNN